MGRARARDRFLNVASFVVGMMAALLLFHVKGWVSHYRTYTTAQVDIPMTTFEGSQWTTNSTMGATTLASCKYGQFQRHTVRTDSGVIAKDWLWTNDRDQINVLVQMGAGDLFMISRERRYGLDADSYSAVNGYVRHGETPRSAAMRVLHEGYGVNPGELGSTGTYRIQVNRGGGFLHTFISKNSTAFPTAVGTASSKKKIILSRQKIIDLLLSGKFILEAQWAATLALGVLMM